MPAIKINLAICWENYLQNKILINTIFKLGKNFYFKVLSAVINLLRDFTQDILTLFNNLCARISGAVLNSVHRP